MISVVVYTQKFSFHFLPFFPLLFSFLSCSSFLFYSLPSLHSSFLIITYLSFPIIFSSFYSLLFSSLLFSFLFISFFLTSPSYNCLLLTFNKPDFTKGIYYFLFLLFSTLLFSFLFFSFLSFFHLLPTIVFFSPSINRILLKASSWQHRSLWGTVRHFLTYPPVERGQDRAMIILKERRKEGKKETEEKAIRRLTQKMKGRTSSEGNEIEDGEDQNNFTIIHTKRID